MAAILRPVENFSVTTAPGGSARAPARPRASRHWPLNALFIEEVLAGIGAAMPQATQGFREFVESARGKKDRILFVSAFIGGRHVDSYLMGLLLEELAE